MCNATLWDRQPDFRHCRFEERAVLRFLDGGQFRTDQFNPILIQRTGFRKFDRHIQGSLSTERRQQRIRTFFFKHKLHCVRRYRFNIRLIREIRIRHDSGGVAVDEGNLVPLLFQRFTRLRS